MTPMENLEKAVRQRAGHRVSKQRRDELLVAAFFYGLVIALALAVSS